MELIRFINILRYGTKLVTNTEEVRNTNIPKGGQRYQCKLTWCHFLPSQERHSRAIKKQQLIYRCPAQLINVDLHK